MNLSKVSEFFTPGNNPIHIIGCGSVGSAVAELLVRCGVRNITLWDFDDVEPHNIANQFFNAGQIGMPKVEALQESLVAINPELSGDIKLKENGWNGEILTGHIFMCVDNIELRREICEKHKFSRYVKSVFDFRTGLESCQHYAADWSKRDDIERLMSSMQFSHEEAAAETPTSACGTTLGVVTTVRLVASVGVNNYINLVKGRELKRFVNIEAFTFLVDAF